MPSGQETDLNYSTAPRATLRTRTHVGTNYKMTESEIEQEWRQWKSILVRHNYTTAAAAHSQNGLQ